MRQKKTESAVELHRPESTLEPAQTGANPRFFPQANASKAKAPTSLERALEAMARSTR